MFPAISELWSGSCPPVADTSRGATSVVPEKSLGGKSVVPALPCPAYAGAPMPFNCTCGFDLFRCGLSDLGRDVLLVAHTLLHTHASRGVWFRALVAFWLTWSGAPAYITRLPLERVIGLVFECFNNSYLMPSEYQAAMCQPDPMLGCGAASLALGRVMETSRLGRAWSALASLPVAGDKLRFVMSDLLTIWVPALMVGRSRYAGGLANYYTLFCGLVPPATDDLVRLAFSTNEMEDPTTNLPTFTMDQALHRYSTYSTYLERRSTRIRGRRWSSVSDYMKARDEDGAFSLTAEIADTCLASGRTHSVSAVNEAIYMFEHMTASRRGEDSDTGAVAQGFIPAHSFDTESESPGGLFLILWCHLGGLSHCWDAASVMAEISTLAGPASTDCCCCQLRHDQRADPASLSDTGNVPATQHPIQYAHSNGNAAVTSSNADHIAAPRCSAQCTAPVVTAAPRRPVGCRRPRV